MSVNTARIPENKASLKQSWWFIALFLIFFPLMIYLGFWQLSRAEEKSQLLAVYQQQRELPAVSLSALLVSEAKQFRAVTLQGQFDTHRYWLLDNRPKGGQSGYQVVMPLITEEYTVLVNRGWIAAPLDRRELPRFSTPKYQVTITGSLYHKEENALIKHSDSDLNREWPQRVLQLDPKVAAITLGEEVYPFLLRLEADSDAALEVDWQPVVSGPEKHIGYAVQWFSMAVTLFCLFTWVMLIRDRYSMKKYENNMRSM